MPLLAVHGRSAGSTENQWRCYSPTCLGPDKQQYLKGSGTLYCTSEAVLEALLKTCESPPTPVPAPVPTQAAAIWPLVQEYTPVAGSLSINASTFSFCFVPTVSSIAIISPLLSAAFDRYCRVLFGHNSSASCTCNRNYLSNVSAPSAFKSKIPVLHSLDVKIETTDETLSLDTNESYTLTILPPAATAAKAATSGVLHARTVYGVLRGLETLAQLVTYDQEHDNANHQISLRSKMSGSMSVPAVRIQDYPKYLWRGFMVDTGTLYTHYE